MHNPLTLSEAERLASLRRYEILDTPPEETFDRITALAARFFHAPISLVSLVDEDRQWFKARCGLDASETPRSASFCSHAIQREEVMVVPDATADPRFADNPLVTGEPRIRFYAGAPLIMPDGHRLGSLCVIDRQPRSFGETERTVLRQLAAMVVDELSLRGLLRQNRQWTTAIDSIGAGVILVDPRQPDWPITFANPGFLALTGYSREEVLGRNCRFLQGPGTDPEAIQALRTAARSAQPFQGQLLNYRKDGTSFWNCITISPVFDETGTLVSYVGLQTDVTAQKHAETLAQQKTEAERANAAKSEFLSRMSHELRTPLNAILGFSQLMEISAAPGDEESRESIRHILGAGRHLLKMVDEVLDIARIESGQFEMDREPVSVASLLTETASLIRPLAAQSGVHLLPFVDAGAARYVIADNQRLKQVLINLFSNAVKYNEKGGSVRVRCVPGPAGCLRVCVADNGPTIAEDLRARLFTPFDRLGAERSVVPGSGLGLALSKRLVEAMGGRIGFEPGGAGEGEGMEKHFWVELPLADDPGARSGAVGTGEGSHWPPQERRPCGRTILYIEDNLSNLRLVERLLEQFPQVRLLTAMQGSIGLDMARQHRPDLVLLDVHLPDLPGAEVLAQLRAGAATRAVPVAVISADATERQMERMTAAGAAAYLTKPIDVHQFLRVVRRSILGDASRN